MIDVIQEQTNKEKKKEVENEIEENNENRENTNINNNIINNKNSSNSESQIFVRVPKEQVILTMALGSSIFLSCKCSENSLTYIFMNYLCNFITS